MKFISIILLAFAACFLFGCVDVQDPSSAESGTSEESEVNFPRPERNEIIEKYTFLKSKYTVTAVSELHDIKYTYDYYFVDGSVGGMRQRVTFSNPENARKYYTDIVSKCPEAIINASTVTYYVGEDAFCYGFPLDKLKYQLEKIEYEYTVNFNEEEFLEKFEQSKAKTVTPQP